MKKLLIIFLIAFHFNCFSQSLSQISWYKMLAGRIDTYPITMHLHKANHQYSGYYYYDLQQQPIYFIGEDTTSKGRIKLISFAASEGTEEFDFSITDSIAKGVWKKDEKSKPIAFTAIEKAAPVTFSYVYTAGVVKLRPSMKNSPQATYEAASVWPNKNTVTGAFLKTVIGKSFSKNYLEKEEIGNLFIKEKRSYFASYLRENVDVKESELKNSLPIYTEDLSNRILIAYQSPKLLTLAFSTYSYTGGAHGNYGTAFTSINLTNSKKLKLQDIVNTQGQKLLGSLLEKHFRVSHNLSATDSLQKGGLFENTIKPNNNFYVTSKGLGFNYTPYEIGPYVMGEINIFIPEKELEKYLMPAFRELIK